METEKELNEKDVIVSSTDLKGNITYANKVFCNTCEYSTSELYGKPHNIIRHPDMPKAVFKFAWDNLKNNKTVVAYVKNYTKDKEKFYWVKAVIIPIYKNGNVVQYTSYRTKPIRYAIEQITQIYKVLLDYERGHSVDETLILLVDYLSKRNLTYDQFMNKLNNGKQVLNDKLLSIDVKQLKVDHIIFRSNIQSNIQKGNTSIKVSKPCCCAFGKKLLSLDGESFTNDLRFTQVKQIHEKVHSQMEVYVDTNEKERKIILNNVQQDIDEIFNILDDLINNYKSRY